MWLRKCFCMNFLAVPFVRSLSLERNLFCVLLEGHWFQSFSWRMLEGKYKMETVEKHQRACYRRMLAVAICAIETYRHLLWQKVISCMECPVMFLKCIFTSLHSIKLKVVFFENLKVFFRKGHFCRRLQLHFIWYLGRDSCKNY